MLIFNIFPVKLEFNTSDYRDEWGLKSEKDPETCFYRGYRKSFNETDDRYGLSPQYWHVFAARLAFVVVFEHVVFILTGIFQLLIPDIPVEVKTQMQREQLLAKEAKYQHGLKKSKETEYSELIAALREQNNNSRQSMGGTGKMETDGILFLFLNKWNLSRSQRFVGTQIESFIAVR